MKMEPVLLLLFLIQVISIYCQREEKIPLEPEVGPHGMPYNKTTSCTEFGKFARFNPYSVVNNHWFTFYYWATPNQPMSYKFRVPTKKDTHYLHYLMDTRVADNFNWSAPMLLQIDQRDQTASLLVENGDRGQYHLYLFDELYNMPIGSHLAPQEIRIKQVEKGKYIGIMICKSRIAYIMCKIEEVPPKNKLLEEASKLGYIGRKGKSYLYQGNGFMPIPDGDEQEFWRYFYAQTPVIYDTENNVYH